MQIRFQVWGKAVASFDAEVFKSSVTRGNVGLIFTNFGSMYMYMGRGRDSLIQNKEYSSHIYCSKFNDAKVIFNCKDDGR